MGQRPSNLSCHDTRMIEQLPKLRRCQVALADLEIREPANVSRIETVEGLGIRQVILNRGPQDFDGRSWVVLMQFDRCPNRRQAVILDHGVQWKSLTERIG